MGLNMRLGAALIVGGDATLAGGGLSATGP